jgi:hypothetical protein
VRAAQAVNELLACGRRRTLLNLLEALLRYETHGAAHGGAPPSANYGGRPASLADAEEEVHEVVRVSDEDAEAAMVTCVLDDQRDEWDELFVGDGEEDTTTTPPPPNSVKGEDAHEAALPAAAAAVFEGHADQQQQPPRDARRLQPHLPALPPAVLTRILSLLDGDAATLCAAACLSRAWRAAVRAQQHSLLRIPAPAAADGGGALHIIDALGDDTLSGVCDDAARFLQLMNHDKPVQVTYAKARLSLCCPAADAGGNERGCARLVVVLAAHTRAAAAAAAAAAAVAAPAAGFASHIEPLFDVRSGVVQPLADAACAIIAAVPAAHGCLLIEVHFSCAQPAAEACAALQAAVSAAATAARLRVTLSFTVGATKPRGVLYKRLAGYHTWLFDVGAACGRPLEPEQALTALCDAHTVFLRHSVPRPLVVLGAAAEAAAAATRKRPRRANELDELQPLRPGGLRERERLLASDARSVPALLDDDGGRWVSHEVLCAALPPSAGGYAAVGMRIRRLLARMPVGDVARGCGWYADGRVIKKAYRASLACDLACACVPERAKPAAVAGERRPTRASAAVTAVAAPA